jgi:hypothetical protein
MTCRADPADPPTPRRQRETNRWAQLPDVSVDRGRWSLGCFFRRARATPETINQSSPGNPPSYRLPQRAQLRVPRPKGSLRGGAPGAAREIRRSGRPASPTPRRENSVTAAGRSLLSVRYVTLRYAGRHDPPPWPCTIFSAARSRPSIKNSEVQCPAHGKEASTEPAGRARWG